MTDKELFQQSEKLEANSTNLWNVINYLDAINRAQIVGDNFSVTYFLNSDHLDTLSENLQNIARALTKVSNVICPDEFDSSEVE
ncbi:hypothetical protein [Lactiplantibacillus plantarum]|uniref:hypothetical protein n=1 Tax=Lactiplantibacillus plantarum TaxID=1590 RepID=UPI001BA49238|nr:hypothetical protein [Lactiplantibacillus plantarum]MBS0954700.1 hypothetical protein [Lactiplantibacillus plantarum]